MAPTTVVCLRIDKFRRFHDITIPFGERITIIAGQNGTSKSTLLGMLAQPFSFGVVRGRTAGTPDHSTYTKNYHGLELNEYVDLAGRPFMYDCDDIFRLSRAFDFGKRYEYRTELSPLKGGVGILPDNRLVTVSRHQKSKDGEIVRMRFVTGPGASHKPGEGNFPHPVIYLGLNRLWPLAVTKKCTFSGETLSDEDREWYVDKYNEVLCLEERGNGAKFMDTVEKKRFITPESTDYDGESCSAGQDNLSQLLTAILSFRRLKKKLGDRYQGGLLLIDELDATLHAFAQERLLGLLRDISHELDLQIIATSHSLHLLETAYYSSLKSDIAVLYLANSDGAISCEECATYQDLSDYIKVQATQPPKKRARKVSVIVEDLNGRSLFWQICGSKLRNYVACADTSTSLGAGTLKNFAEMSTSVPALAEVIFLPDGDMAGEWKSPPKGLLALPGGHRPETLIYRHLFTMKDSDPFWRKCAPTYKRQVAITKPGGISLEVGDDKKWVKNWYKEQSQYWGRGNQKVFKSWIGAHQQECLAFYKKFIKLLRGRYKGEIPTKVIDGVLAKLKDS